MRKLAIPKRNGKTRMIYIPSEDQKVILRTLAGNLEKKSRRCCPEGVVHGFIRGRSPVTNAQSHVGHEYTLSFDLQDFFDHVKERQLVNHLSKDEMTLCLVDGAARQGLPTSPAVANLAASDMDNAVIKWRDKNKFQFIYTRYADDMTFSYDDPELTEVLKRQVPKFVGRCGFKLNKRKTRLQSAKRGRRIITGIAVDGLIHPTRAAKRRLRAAKHQQKKNRARGLAEWCRLQPPKSIEGKEYVGNEVERLCKAWRLQLLRVDKLPDKQSEQIGKRCIVTGDPVYMLGMSTWTTGWRSCYSQPSGEYRHSVVYWCYVRGARIAAYLSDKTKAVGGVERRVMRARCLVYEFRNGQRAYGKLYGNPGDKEKLAARLRSAGYIPVSKVAKGDKVIGHGPAKNKVYLDDLKSSVAKATKGPWKGRKVRTVGVQ